MTSYHPHPPHPRAVRPPSPSPHASTALDAYSGAPLYSPVTPPFIASPPLSASSPTFRYQPSYSPSFNGDELSYPSFLDQRYSSPSPTPSNTSSYSFSLSQIPQPPSQPQPQLPPPSQPSAKQPLQSAVAFSSLAASDPLSHSLRPSPPFPSHHSQHPQHSQLSQSHPPLPLHQPHPQPHPPPQPSASHSLPSSSHLSGSLPPPRRPPMDAVKALDSSYALNAIASMSRKRERDHPHEQFSHVDRSLQLPLPSQHFPHDELPSPDSFMEGPYHPDPFSHFPSAPPGYEKLAPFPSSVSSDSSGSSASSPLPLFVLPNFARDASPISYRKSSCLLCHRAKTSCDGRRPCDRCIRLDRQEQCVERTKGSSKRKPVVGKKRKAGEEGAEEEGKDDELEKGGVDIDEDEVSSPPPQPASSIPATASPSAVSSTSSVTSASSQTILPVQPVQPVQPTPSASAILLDSGEPTLISASDRELSALMLRILQSDQVSIRSLLRTASQKRLVPDMAFQAIISYLANSLHPEDYAAFMTWIDSEGAGAEGDAFDRLQIRLPDGKRMPRVLFTYRKSSLVALPDSDIAVNTAQILVWRVKPGAIGGAAVDRPAQPPLDAGGKANKAKDDSQPPRASSSPATTSTSTSSPQPFSPLSPAPSSIADGEAREASSPASELLDSVAPPPPPAPTSEVSPFVPAPVPGATFGSLSEVDLVIQVNREFERLFGYSQREMKDLVMREQAKGLYRLYTPQSLLIVGRWLTEAVVGVRTEFRAIVHVVNKWKGITPVVFNARFILDAAGFFSSVCYSYTALPESYNSDGSAERTKEAA